jgi:hypothetical protein
MSIICAIDLFVVYQTIHLCYSTGHEEAIIVDLEEVPQRLADLTEAYPSYEKIILCGVHPYIDSIAQEITLIKPDVKIQLR